MSGRIGILFATPGTTCESAAGVYDQISAAASLRFAGVEPRWTYTSAPIRRKLAARGANVTGPAETLSAMQAEGFTRVAVMPLHLADGMEFAELERTVTDWSCPHGSPLKVAIGHALFTSPSDWQRAVAAIVAELPEPRGLDDRIILVAHGSRDPQAQKTIRAAAALCRKVDRRVILGMMLGKPDLEDVLRECRSEGVRKAWLAPCMVVAGFSARADIAGTGGQSWASTLKRAGIEPAPVIRGLGEINGIIQLWLDTCGKMLDELTGPDRWKDRNA